MFPLPLDIIPKKFFDQRRRAKAHCKLHYLKITTYHKCIEILKNKKLETRETQIGNSKKNIDKKMLARHFPQSRFLISNKIKTE